MVSIFRWLSLSLILACGSLVPAADKGPDFSGQDLPGKNFIKQSLDNANFEDAVLKTANFDGAIATRANFQGADLSYANFNNADLSNADFRGARFAYTKFFQATLNGANLEKADLSLCGSGFSHSTLRKANLRNLKAMCPAYYSDLSEADLRGANLLAMKVIGNETRFRKAKYDSKTRWPKDFDIEASGAILVEEPDKSSDDELKPASGKNEPSKDFEKEFSALDINEDGRLSGKEMRGLEELDVNKDGKVTLEEFKAGMKK